VEKIDLTIQEIRTLILNAVMTGNQTNKIDIENAPDVCPMDVVMACDFVLNQFLDNKIEALKADDIDNAIKDLLKGTN
jgi:hypothetical protein